MIDAPVPENGAALAELWSKLTQNSNIPMAAGFGSGHRIQFVNPAFCKLVGKPREELIGQPFAVVVPRSDKCLLALDRVSRTGVGESHTEVEQPEPHPLYWSYVMWPIRPTDQGSEGVVIQVTESAEFHHQVSSVNEALVLAALRHDELREAAYDLNSVLQSTLTDALLREEALLRIEGELRVLSESLEQNVRDRTADLMALTERLQGFSYLVAHDLRQQIRGINIHARLVLDETEVDLSGSAQQHLTGLIGSSMLLATLVDDMLAYAHIGTRQARTLRVDLSHAAQQYVEKMKIAYPEVSFEIQEGLFANGDPAMLYLVIENLIGNACKFSSRQEHPVIEVGRLGSEFFVRDNGIGFEMAYATKVFEPFERLHRGEFPGSGIGLAIVERIIEKHGGTVRAESALGEGSTFFCEVPA
jgi:PAS domain S-box-containing protein